MANRKYTRYPEKAEGFECTKRKCKWQGTLEQQVLKRKNEYSQEYACPKCGNSEFYGLLKFKPL